jgi:hypothetical protein
VLRYQKSGPGASWNRSVLRQRRLLPTCAAPLIILRIFIVFFLAGRCFAQSTDTSKLPNAQPAGSQINVNWLYGSYIPKNVPRLPLNRDQRVTLYIRQTYTTPGIYVKTAFFAMRDQIAGSNSQWGDDFAGYAKRYGSRQAQFIIQNSVISLGDGLVGWEPRYDRCQCDGLWLRTRHAIVRNFVTYDRTEKSLRPQIMPYLGSFTGAALATTWEPGRPVWQVKGYQAAITQVFVGVGVNWIGEFLPDILKPLKRKKS